MCVRAGAGGDEAGIWVGDLLRMYQRYSQNQRWTAKMVSCTEADAGGYKEVIVQVCNMQWHVMLLYSIYYGREYLIA